MRSQVVRGILAATFVSTLLIPAVGSNAGPGDELDSLEHKLDKVRSEISVKGERADSLKGRIDVLNRDITTLQIEINRLDSNITEIESEVHTAQAAIDRKQTSIDQIEDVATEQAVVLYKTGSIDMLDTLLSAESLVELNDRIEMMGVAASRNTNELVRFHRLQLEIQSDQAELFAKKRELTAVLDSRSKLQNSLSERRTELAANYNQLEGELASLQAREGDLETEAFRLTGDIQSAQARQSVAALGESATGFIWPLNGAITSYYGERWGGMHTGIDIDGYTGQPIVASKAGVVILASYYSGYGNAVVVDHGGGVATLYGHMSEFGTSNGASVEQGEVIGYVGCTGSCTGDHLHFEVRINGNPVNPLDYLP